MPLQQYPNDQLDSLCALGETIVEFKELNNVVAAMGAALGLAVYGITVWQCSWRPDSVWLLGAWGMVSVGAVCGIMTRIPKLQNHFRFCTNGVEVIRRGHSRSVTLAEMEGFTFSKSHSFQNGVYTTSTAKFVIDPDRRLQFRFSMSFRKNSSKEQRLDAFCDLVTHAVAIRMLHEIRKTGRSHWTAGVTITDSGLELAVGKGPAGAAHVEEIPFAAICEYCTSNGVFELRGGSRRVMESNVSASNFLPGLRLLQWLSEEAKLKASQPVPDQSATKSLDNSSVEVTPR